MGADEFADGLLDGGVPDVLVAAEFLAAQCVRVKIVEVGATPPASLALSVHREKEARTGREREGPVVEPLSLVVHFCEEPRTRLG